MRSTILTLSHKKNPKSETWISLEAFDRLEEGVDDELDSDFNEYLTGDDIDITEGKDIVVNTLRGKVDIWGRPHEPEYPHKRSSSQLRGKLPSN